MSSDLSWEPQYCLSCDVRTDEGVYCSESCKLKDWENTSSASSTATSPGFAEPQSFWSVPTKSRTGFTLTDPYDFQNAVPYGSTPVARSHLPHRATFASTSTSTRVLTPSSSHSSLSSLGSTASVNSDAGQISSTTKKHLRDYSNSFENARPQHRRRSC